MPIPLFLDDIMSFSAFYCSVRLHLLHTHGQTQNLVIKVEAGLHCLLQIHFQVYYL